MSNFQSITKSFHQERGVALIFSATFILLVFMVYISATVDSHRLHQSRALLYLVTERECSAAARMLPVARRSVELLINRVNLLDVDKFSPQVDLLPYAELTKVNVTIPSPLLSSGDTSPFTIIPPTSVSQFGHPNCQNSICTFAGDINEPSVQSIIPANHWSVEEGNNEIVCEFKANVQTFLSGVREVTAKVAYQRIVRPRREDRLPTGLTIGIANAVTYRYDQRFQFSGDPLLSEYDPFAAGFDSASPPTSGNMAYGFQRQSYSHNKFLGNPFQPTAELSGTAFPGSTYTGLFQSPRYQQLARCANPHITLVRAMMQSFFYRLGRSADTRDKVQLLMAQPMNDDLSPNLPVSMVDWGADLLASNYEPPLMNYSSSAQTYDPFTDPSQMPLTHQVRDCYVALNSANGVKAPHDYALENFDASAIKNYEPMAFQSGNFLVSDDGSISQNWSATGNADLRKAEDLAKSISNFERCPYEGLGGCLKSGAVVPAVPEKHDRSDIVSFLKYTIGTGRKYNSPGFAIPPGGAAPTKILNPEISSPGGLRSQVLLVLFQRIDPVVEKAQIQALAQKLENAERAVTVLYFPTIEADVLAYNELKEAFNATDSDSFHRVYMIAPDWSLKGATPEWKCLRDYWETRLKPAAAGNFSQAGDIITSRIFKIDPVL